MTSRAESTADDGRGQLAALRTRLVPAMPGSALWGWLGPLLVTAFGTILRFYRLSVPHSIVFDETYYVPDAFGILRYGTEHNYVSNRNALLARGNPHIFTHGGEFVVHPPFGKMLIAVGEWLFGLTPFGWRFAVAVVGSLAILLIARITRRMTRSTLLGCTAGLLLALDGLEFVMSRTALLDIFVMFWVLAGFGCLVVDRDVHRARVFEVAARRAAANAATPQPSGWVGRDVAEPLRGIRWWRLAAGVCLGLAMASKWNGLWFVFAFAAMSVLWDLGALRVAGLPGTWLGTVAREPRPREITGPRQSRGSGWRAFLAGLTPAATLLVLPAAVYVASWSGWFAASTGYDRQWAAQHGIHIPVVSALISLFEYHKAMLAFNVGLTSGHPYASKPWTWLVLARPVSYFWQCPTSGTAKCGAPGTKAAEILAIGTPVLWWSAVAALLVCLVWWLTRRDWRAGAVLLGVAAGWLPWFAFAGRTQFYFYSVAFVPYLVIAVTLCLGLVLGPAAASVRRRAAGAALAGVYVLAVLLNFAYLYPILTAQAIPYGDWLSRMWSSGWI